MRELREIAERVETRDVIYRRPCHGGKAVSRSNVLLGKGESAGWAQDGRGEGRGGNFEHL